MIYTDLADLIAEGLTAEQIAAQLAASPLTVRAIPKAELRQWLAETGLLRFGLAGPTGWLTLLTEGADPLVVASLDWLADALQNPAIEQIRTDSDSAIAGAFALIVAAATTVTAPEGRPLTVEAITERLNAWTGGVKFDGVTAEQVQAVIDQHTRQQQVASLTNDVMGAIQIETEKPDHTVESVKAAVLAAIT